MNQKVLRLAAGIVTKEMMRIAARFKSPGESEDDTKDYDALYAAAKKEARRLAIKIRRDGEKVETKMSSSYAGQYYLEEMIKLLQEMV